MDRFISDNKDFQKYVFNPFPSPLEVNRFISANVYTADNAGNVTFPSSREVDRVISQ